MIFRQIPKPETGCLTYVVADEYARELAVIDPPEDMAAVDAQIAKIGIRPTLVFETHTHADHISGARALGTKLSIPVHLPFLNRSRWEHHNIDNGACLRVGDLCLRALHTPGHTPCSMSLVMDDRVLVGDALLPGTVGRADFYDDGPEELYHSMFDRLLKLEDRLEVYPAHYGPKHGLPEKMMTSIGHERKTNEALTLKTKDEFIRYLTEGWPPKPHDWEEIVEKNLQG